jgi:hypothetical protein
VDGQATGRMQSKGASHRLADTYEGSGDEHLKGGRARPVRRVAKLLTPCQLPRMVRRGHLSAR